MRARRTPVEELRDQPRLLLLVPLLSYLLSYIWLAIYHGSPLLWNTVIHESGRYTLLETTFYASHFLGHVPVLTVLAFVFAGAYAAMAGDQMPISSLRAGLTAGGLLAGLLLVSLAIGFFHFGAEDTFSFLRQIKQRPDLYTAGGSWKLHLPSTVLQLALIPIVVWSARRLCDRPVAWGRRGNGYLAGAIVGLVAVTWLASTEPLETLVEVWRDPRYLAHSVRELVTFPLTYYPIPLAILLAAEARSRSAAPTDRRVDALAVLLLLVFALGFSYQVVVSLTHDIGSLAQKPEFAKGGELGIPYLLASHFFEHFLDSIYFALLVLLLVWGAARGRET
jgi:hypothetical protein